MSKDRRFSIAAFILALALLAPLPAAALDFEAAWDGFLSWLLPEGWLRPQTEIAASSTTPPPPEDVGGATTSGGDASGCIDPNGAPTPCKPKP